MSFFHRFLKKTKQKQPLYFGNILSCEQKEGQPFCSVRTSGDTDLTSWRPRAPPSWALVSVEDENVIEVLVRSALRVSQRARRHPSLLGAILAAPSCLGQALPCTQQAGGAPAGRGAWSLALPPPLPDLPVSVWPSLEAPPWGQAVAVKRESGASDPTSSRSCLLNMRTWDPLWQLFL